MRLSAPIHGLKRRAKLMARDENIPLHDALDRIAREEGFAAWSLLSSRLTMSPPATSLLPDLAAGDMLLLAARPGHGKTRLGLQLLIDAVREGRRAVFFTLEYTEEEVLDRVQSLNDQGSARTPEIVTSNDISADFITRYLSDAPRETVAVIDYLQILDQQRSKPALAEQLHVLQEFARSTGTILAFISQIDRSYDPERSPVPDLADLRFPNPVPIEVFSKACFLNAGEIKVQRIA